MRRSCRGQGVHTNGSVNTGTFVLCIACINGLTPRSVALPPSLLLLVLLLLLLLPLPQRDRILVPTLRRRVGVGPHIPVRPDVLI